MYYPGRMQEAYGHYPRNDEVVRDGNNEFDRAKGKEVQREQTTKDDDEDKTKKTENPDTRQRASLLESKFQRLNI